MPQTGSTRPGDCLGDRLLARAGRLDPQRDELGVDAERDLRVGARTDVEPGGNVQPLELVGGHALVAQPLDRCGTALRARHQPDVRHARAQGRRRGRLVALTV